MRGTLYRAAQQKRDGGAEKDGEPLLAIALLGTVLTVYLLFCGIQVFYLFLGAGTLPKGVTYADYARTGFFQLLFICLFNIAAVLVIKKYFRENKALNACLLAVCGCTFIMTASSAYRMLLYIGAYYLTVLCFLYWQPCLPLRLSWRVLLFSF